MGATQQPKKGNATPLTPLQQQFNSTGGMKTPLNLMNTQTIRGTSSSKSNYMFSSAERQLKGSSSRYRYESREDEEEEEQSSGFGGAIRGEVQRVLVQANPKDQIYSQ